MNENLQKIDEILKRTNTDYATAKEALDAANGDVLEAIILIESQQKGKTQGSGKGEQIMNQIKDTISKGNATRITIKKNNEVIVNIPITAGLIGAFVAPFLSAAGITAALLTQCSVEITQANGEVINLGQKVDEGIDAVKDAVKDVKKDANEFKEGLKDGYEHAKEYDKEYANDRN